MSKFSQLQQHIHRWQPHAEIASFLTKEIGKRLIERLDLIKLTPGVILDTSNIFYNQTKELLQRYPDAIILATNLNPKLCTRPVGLWQRWQRQAKNFISDVHCLPLANESVDFIFSNCLLYNSWNLPELISEWYRVLKPGGLVLFSSLGPDTLKELRAVQQQINPFIDMHDIGDMLLHQGFSDPVMDMEILTVYYQHFAQLLKDIRANNITTVSIHYPGKLYPQLLEQAYQKFLTEDNKLPVTCEIIYGHAWKINKPEKNATSEFVIPINKIKR